MKKWITWILLILLLLSACTKPAETPEAPQPETEETAELPESEPQPEEEENLFVFTRENLPKLDGSTSMVPLGEAVLAALLGESQNNAADLVDFHRTTESFRYLMRGESDLLLVAEPNQIVFDEMAQQGFEYEMEPIAKEALVFIVNSDNPIQSLTVEQLQGIYTGQITNWSQVGGDDVDIVPFQRNSTSGSQVLMDKLVMGDLEMMEAPQEWVPGEMDSLMQGVRGYEDSAAAIGYSVYYYAEDMRMAEGMKILPIEGVEPTDSTIADGSYPLINYYFSVIGAEAEKDSPTRILFDWLRSADGQALLESQGYVPVGVSVDDLSVYMDSSGLTGFDQPLEICTRRTEEFVDELTPGDYGLLRPYIGSRAAFDMTIYGGSGIYNGSMGLIDENGAIVVDPVYTDIRYLYDQSIGDPVPFYRLSKELWVENDWGGYMGQVYGFCSLDGKIAIPCQYEQITCWGNKIVAVQDADAGMFHVYDTTGNVLLDSANWQQHPTIFLSDGMGTAVATEHLLYFSVRVPKGNGWDVVFHLYDWQGNLISDSYDWVDLSGEPPYTYGNWDQNDEGYLDAWGKEIPPAEQPENVPAVEQIHFPNADQIQELGNGLYLVWQNGVCTMVNGEHTVVLEGAEDYNRNYYSYGYLNGTEDLILVQCYLQQDREYWLLDQDLNLLTSGKLENEGVELLTDRLTGHCVAARYSTMGYYYPYDFYVLDYPGAPKLENVRLLEIYSGWYMVEDDFSSGYMDADGNWLFRVNLMADMTD